MSLPCLCRPPCEVRLGSEKTGFVRPHSRNSGKLDALLAKLQPGLAKNAGNLPRRGKKPRKNRVFSRVRHTKHPDSDFRCPPAPGFVRYSLTTIYAQSGRAGKLKDAGMHKSGRVNLSELAAVF